MIFVDSHVHIYSCFDVDLLLDSALENFRSIAGQQSSIAEQSSFVLMLTEGSEENWFADTSTMLNRSDSEGVSVSQNWKASQSMRSESITVYRNDSPENRIHIIAGKQIVTAEKIEVLGLFLRDRVPTGLALSHTIDMISRAGSVPVLPWGVGKWFGERGGILQNYLEQSCHKNVCLGDNGGRPRFWSHPTMFSLAAEKGISVLPGSDALPLPDEVRRTGSFGFYVRENLPPGQELDVTLKTILTEGKAEIFPFGGLQNNFSFICNQLRLRLAR